MAGSIVKKSRGPSFQGRGFEKRERLREMEISRERPYTWARMMLRFWIDLF